MKTRVVSNRIQENTRLLLEKMRSEKTYLSNNECWESSAVRALNIDGKAKFKDGIYLAKRNKQDKLVPLGENISMLELGKSRITFYQNCKVADFKKPFYVSIKSLMQKAEKYLTIALNSYNNPEKVEKIILKKEGLTLLGISKAKTYFADIFDSMGQMFK